MPIDIGEAVLGGRGSGEGGRSGRVQPGGEVPSVPPSVPTLAIASVPKVGDPTRMGAGGAGGGAGLDCDVAFGGADGEGATVEATVGGGAVGTFREGGVVSSNAGGGSGGGERGERGGGGVRLSGGWGVARL